MKVTIELKAGSTYHEPYQQDIMRNIEAIDRAIQGKPLACDMGLLIDTKSILECIKKQLPVFERQV
ncbi:MAG: hypothetical protein WC364_05830 [Eubacteriales bacterium]|jgi:hypothetical protein